MCYYGTIQDDTIVCDFFIFFEIRLFYCQKFMIFHQNSVMNLQQDSGFVI